MARAFLAAVAVVAILYVVRAAGLPAGALSAGLLPYGLPPVLTSAVCALVAVRAFALGRDAGWLLSAAAAGWALLSLDYALQLSLGATPAAAPHALEGTRLVHRLVPLLPPIELHLVLLLIGDPPRARSPLVLAYLVGLGFSAAAGAKAYIPALAPHPFGLFLTAGPGFDAFCAYAGCLSLAAVWAYRRAAPGLDKRAANRARHVLAWLLASAGLALASLGTAHGLDLYPLVSVAFLPWMVLAQSLGTQAGTSARALGRASGSAPAVVEVDLTTALGRVAVQAATTAGAAVAVLLVRAHVETTIELAFIGVAAYWLFDRLSDALGAALPRERRVARQRAAVALLARRATDCTTLDALLGEVVRAIGESVGVDRAVVLTALRGVLYDRGGRREACVGTEPLVAEEGEGSLTVQVGSLERTLEGVTRVPVRVGGLIVGELAVGAPLGRFVLESSDREFLTRVADLVAPLVVALEEVDRAERAMRVPAAQRQLELARIGNALAASQSVHLLARRELDGIAEDIAGSARAVMSALEAAASPGAEVLRRRALAGARTLERAGGAQAREGAGVPTPPSIVPPALLEGVPIVVLHAGDPTGQPLDPDQLGPLARHLVLQAILLARPDAPLRIALSGTSVVLSWSPPEAAPAAELARLFSGLADHARALGGQLVRTIEGEGRRVELTVPLRVWKPAPSIGDVTSEITLDEGLQRITGEIPPVAPAGTPLAYLAVRNHHTRTELTRALSPAFQVVPVVDLDALPGALGASPRAAVFVDAAWPQAAGAVLLRRLEGTAAARVALVPRESADAVEALYDGLSLDLALYEPLGPDLPVSLRELRERLLLRAIRGGSDGGSNVRREALLRQLQRFVAPARALELVAASSRDPAARKPARRPVTALVLRILLADAALVGQSAASIAALAARVTSVILHAAHGGGLDAAAVDASGALLLAGAADSLDPAEGARRAIAVAQAAARALRPLEAGLPPGALRLAAGLHTAVDLAGFFGDGPRMQLGALGSSVHVAAELAVAASAAREIRLTEATARALPAGTALAQLRPMAGHNVYRLLDSPGSGRFAAS